MSGHLFAQLKTLILLTLNSFILCASVQIGFSNDYQFCVGILCFIDFSIIKKWKVIYFWFNSLLQFHINLLHFPHQMNWKSRFFQWLFHKIELGKSAQNYNSIRLVCWMSESIFVPNSLHFSYNRFRSLKETFVEFEKFITATNILK